MNYKSASSKRQVWFARHHFRFLALVPLAVLVWFSASSARAYSAQERTGAAASSKPSIVLVPGAYEDGSIWTKVVRLLQANGFHVTVVPIPLTSLAADAAITKSVIARQQAPVILVGHSWGGVVITEAGNEPERHRPRICRGPCPRMRPRLRGHAEKLPRGKTSSPIHTDDAGRKWIDVDEYPEAWAGDLDIADARVLAATQKTHRHPIVHGQGHSGRLAH